MGAPRGRGCVLFVLISQDRGSVNVCGRAERKKEVKKGGKEREGGVNEEH